jgi:hypothetical protein
MPISMLLPSRSLPVVSCSMYVVANHPTTCAVAVLTHRAFVCWQVVIQDEATGKRLLEEGKLQKRVTFIPLNKIDTRAIAPAVVNKAQQIVGTDNVSLALSLVGYDPEVQAAMEYCFGNTLVCKGTVDNHQACQCALRSATHQRYLLYRRPKCQEGHIRSKHPQTNRHSRW